MKKIRRRSQLPLTGQNLTRSQ
uniref:Uncharacterized protein n=1 Tax=Anguilla anguilla TaxID=7936 RepID=A0A0E9PPE7_ANGAN